MRINLWGGPGSGKSATAPDVFARLKKNGCHAEIILEYIKKWAYQKRKPISYDQVYVFGKQLHAEDLLLQNNVDYLVTDSPILMSVWYCKAHRPNLWEHLLGLAMEFEKEYPSINIFLDREGIPYKEEGRFQTQDEALKMDKDIYEFALTHAPNIKRIRTLDFESIMNHIKKGV